PRAGERERALRRADPQAAQARRRRDRIPPQIRRGIAAESRRGGRPRQGDARSGAGKGPMNLKDWIGRTETVDDIVTAMPYAALSATLDREPARPKQGTSLPALWHWLYFLPLHRQSEIGPDGDRKSTRLNSSHQITSYAVFCL